MDELLAQFLVEAPELLEQADDALLALEKAPGDSACLNDAFRAVHTLKGSVGLFDLPPLERLLHAAEDTAVVWGMPGELVRAGGAGFVEPLDRIADRLLELANAG